MPSSICTYRIARVRAEATPYGLNDSAPSTCLTRPSVAEIASPLITAIVTYIYWGAAPGAFEFNNHGYASETPPITPFFTWNKSYVFFTGARVDSYLGGSLQNRNAI